MKNVTARLSAMSGEMLDVHFNDCAGIKIPADLVSLPQCDDASGFFHFPIVKFSYRGKNPGMISSHLVQAEKAKRRIETMRIFFTARILLVKLPPQAA